MEFVAEEDSDSDDEDDWNDDDDGTVTWDSLDTTLSRLAKRVSKVEGRLTLRIKAAWPLSSVKFDRLLSQFLEYGELDINRSSPPV